jgi:hypothetical protein
VGLKICQGPLLSIPKRKLLNGGQGVGVDELGQSGADMRVVLVMIRQVSRISSEVQQSYRDEADEQHRGCSCP